VPRKPLKPREKRGYPDPDLKYDSVLAARFIGKINFRGQKSLAERVFYKALDIIKEKTKEDPLNVFTRAIENVRPLLEVKPRRVGGATFQVPVEVPSDRSTTMAMRWIIDLVRVSKGKPIHERLAGELMAASKKEGLAIKKREDTHKMAEANKAFAHYRW